MDIAIDLGGSSVVPRSIAPNTVALEIRLYQGAEVTRLQPCLEAYQAGRAGPGALSLAPSWIDLLAASLRQRPYCLTAERAGKICGFLPLAYLRGPLFGKFLISLPYVNYGGVQADDDATARQLIDGAIALADQLDVRFLELRHEKAIDHPRLHQNTGCKVHMRLPLPATAEALWKGLPSKVRNQVRKGQKCGLTFVWGGEALLPDFYNVFSRNMRDLGTPVYGASLFREILRRFPDQAELCVGRLDGQPIAAALLLHGQGTTEVPSASSLRSHNSTCANMAMYWQLLERATLRGQATFDFGRSSPESSTHQFKKQWGATATPAIWQYYLRVGAMADMRRENPRYQRAIGLWQRLPVCVTRWIGPAIVGGIP